MNRVCERLWIGDARDGQDIQALQEHGITAVFNATNETDNWPAEFKQATPYLRLNQDDGASIPIEKLVSFLVWMRVQMDGGKTVLVHCGAGVSRAASFTIAWLMACGFGWDEAETLVRAVRPIIMPHSELKRSVLRFFRHWPYDWSYA